MKNMTETGWKSECCDAQATQYQMELKSPIGGLPYYNGDICYQTQYQQRPVMESDRVREARALANIAVDQHYRILQADYEKKAADEEKRTYEDGRRAERRADIASQRELQKTNVYMSSLGNPINN